MKLVTIDHHIQRGIMKSLVAEHSATYSQLKPAGIESNLFLYHLKQLVRQELVEKRGKQYCLTLLGKQHVDRSTLQTLHTRIQPKVVTILVVRDSGGQYMILERLHQPFICIRGFPSGKIHYGEDLEQAAYRELAEKTQLIADDISLELRGNIIMRFYSNDNGEVVNHVVGYVFSGTTTANGRGAYNQAHFRSYWGVADELHGDKCFKGHPEILKLLETSGQFLASYDFPSSF